MFRPGIRDKLTNKYVAQMAGGVLFKDHIGGGVVTKKMLTMLENENISYIRHVMHSSSLIRPCMHLGVASDLHDGEANLSLMLPCAIEQFL